MTPAGQWCPHSDMQHGESGWLQSWPSWHPRHWTPVQYSTVQYNPDHLDISDTAHQAHSSEDSNLTRAMCQSNTDTVLGVTYTQIIAADDPSIPQLQTCQWECCNIIKSCWFNRTVFDVSIEELYYLRGNAKANTMYLRLQRANWQKQAAPSIFDQEEQVRQ